MKLSGATGSNNGSAPVPFPKLLWHSLCNPKKMRKKGSHIADNQAPRHTIPTVSPGFLVVNVRSQTIQTPVSRAFNIPIQWCGVPSQSRGGGIVASKAIVQ
ncbi:hypothetical protein B0H14DRAFT_2572452 [Mycena olivaceomarginata]|nr:hypothetical protein B0H14DRAFT_2572452 [Mycena olivaceomarginata]